MLHSLAVILPHPATQLSQITLVLGPTLLAQQLPGGGGGKLCADSAVSSSLQYMQKLLGSLTEVTPLPPKLQVYIRETECTKPAVSAEKG